MDLVGFGVLSIPQGVPWGVPRGVTGGYPWGGAGGGGQGILGASQAGYPRVLVNHHGGKTPCPFGLHQLAGHYAAPAKTCIKE